LPRSNMYRPSQGSLPASQSEASGSQELFGSREDVDRTPKAWAARLTQMLAPKSAVGQTNKPAGSNELVPTTPAEDGGPEGQSVEKDQPISLSQNTRRFLKPLLKIDPASVEVRQGTGAAEITSASHADAATDSDSIVLKPGYLNDTPEQLGLLAHELTHVARRRVPRFIPPIARDPKSEGLRSSSVELMNEEELAGRVEARVVSAAKTFENGFRSSQPPLEETRPAVPIEENTVPLMPAPGVQIDKWAGLPAPWEPLPKNLVVSPDNEVGNESNLSTADEVRASAADGSDTAGPPPLQLAEEGRSLGEETAPHHGAAESTEPTKSGRHVPPDLDTLAREVYMILKRRLAAERRRELS